MFPRKVIHFLVVGKRVRQCTGFKRLKGMEMLFLEDFSPEFTKLCMLSVASVHFLRRESPSNQAQTAHSGPISICFNQATPI